jgi:hypothetical protein
MSEQKLTPGLEKGCCTTFIKEKRAGARKSIPVFTKKYVYIVCVHSIKMNMIIKTVFWLV